LTFAAIQWAIDQNTGHSSAKFVLVILAHHANDHGTAWPSTAELIRTTELDRKSVIRALTRLAAKGLIHDTGQRKGSTGQIKVWKLGVDQPGLNLPTPKRARKQSQKRDSFNADKQSQKRDSLDDGEESQNWDALRVPKTAPLETKESQKRNGSVFPAKSPNFGTRNLLELPLEEESSYNPPLDSDEQCARIFAVYNDVAEANDLPIAQQLSLPRKRSLKKRIQEHGFEPIINAVKSIPQSAFLTGHNDSGWRVHFDFLLQASSLTKLIEGFYHHAPKTGQQPQPAEQPYWKIYRDQQRKAAAAQRGDLSPYGNDHDD
jgi:hypothetical protein